MGRQDELADAACDYVLERGLIGLSLRPLAAAIGTSDRMLVYHFGSRDALVAEIIERSTKRSLALLESFPSAADVASGVRALWAAHDDGSQFDRCQRVYAQAAATGLLGDDSIAVTVGRSNEEWITGLAGYLERCGADPSRSLRCARFVDAAISGLHLDRHLERDLDVSGTVDDVAAAALLLTARTSLHRV